MGNMYDLPLIETEAVMEPEALLQLPEAVDFFGRDVAVRQGTAVIKHVLTHQQLFIRFIVLDGVPLKLKETWFYTTVLNMENLAMPKTIFIFIKDFFNF
jgi:A/G-specific adenine glycosylase